MTLREDNGPYCLVWLGMLLLGAFYMSFVYAIITDTAAAAQIFNPSNFFLLSILWVLPPVMTFLFTGYLRPTRGKAKMTMLGPSVLAGLFFFIIAFVLSGSSTLIENLLVFSAWGIGSAVLTAGGFSIAQSYEQSTSRGMLDVSSLHYGPPKEEEVEEEVTEPEATNEAVAETPEAEKEAKVDSDESKSTESE